MKRRHVVALLGYFSLGGAAARWRPLRAFGRPDPREHIARAMTAVVDVMFPGAAGRASRQEVLFELATSPGPRQAFDVEREAPRLRDRYGRNPLGQNLLLARRLVESNQRATLQGASDFLALDEAQRLAALDAAFASPDQGIQPFVLALRYHVGTAYYSAPAIKSAFAYTGPPQPDGFADFQERPA